MRDFHHWGWLDVSAARSVLMTLKHLERLFNLHSATMAVRGQLSIQLGQLGTGKGAMTRCT